MRRILWLLYLCSIFGFLNIPYLSFGAELFGQVLYMDGRPARYVRIQIEKRVGDRIERMGQVSTDPSGFYRIDREPGKYTLKVKNREKTIYLSSKGTRVDFRISR